MNENVDSGGIKNGRNQEPDEPGKLCVVIKEKDDFLTAQGLAGANCLIGVIGVIGPSSVGKSTLLS